MKERIRNILREDAKTKVVIDYVKKIWQRDVDSGKIPEIPVVDLKRKRLYQFYPEIRQAYFDFVGGKETALANFESSIEGVTLTDKNLRSQGWYDIQDTFTFEILGVVSTDFRDENDISNEFVFEVLGGTFHMTNGTYTWEELMPEDMDDTYNEVANWIRELIEDYVDLKGRNFGFEFTSYGSWA